MCNGFQVSTYNNSLGSVFARKVTIQYVFDRHFTINMDYHAIDSNNWYLLDSNVELMYPYLTQASKYPYLVVV